MIHKKPSLKIILYSSIGLIALALTYFVDWTFIIISAAMVLLNQRELMKK